MYIIDYIILLLIFTQFFSNMSTDPLALSCGPLRTLLWPLEIPCIVLEERKQHVSAVLLQQPVGRACEREFSQNDLSSYVVFYA